MPDPPKNQRDFVTITLPEITCRPNRPHTHKAYAYSIDDAPGRPVAVWVPWVLTEHPINRGEILSGRSTKVRVDRWWCREKGVPYVG